MKVKSFFDKDTYTLTYVAYDPNTKDAVINDPVLDYDPNSSTLSKESLNELLEFVNSEKLILHYSFETHAHADHITSAQELKTLFPDIKTAIHENIIEVQKTFETVFNLDIDTEGRVFDLLLEDNKEYRAGSLNIKVLHTPGHTPACASLLVNEKSLFTGDALFMPDFGTGRCDFPKGSAKDLYHSIHNKIYKLPDDTEIYVGHDYQPNGRDLRFKTTVQESKEKNIQLKQATSEEDFIKFREARDKTLKAPRLLLPSIQVNIQNGQLNKAESNDISYLKLPLKKGWE